MSVDGNLRIRPALVFLVILEILIVLTSMRLGEGIQLVIIRSQHGLDARLTLNWDVRDSAKEEC